MHHNRLYGQRSNPLYIRYCNSTHANELDGFPADAGNQENFANNLSLDDRSPAKYGGSPWTYARRNSWASGEDGNPYDLDGFGWSYAQIRSMVISTDPGDAGYLQPRPGTALATAVGFERERGLRRAGVART